MDVLAHTLWTNAVFYYKYARRRRQRYWAAFFGVAPDLVSFVPIVIYALFSGRLFQGGPWYAQVGGMFEYGPASYNFTHSFVIFLAVFVLVILIRRGKPFWPLLGWALHILIDIFTHPDFYQTPFLFPLSDVRNTHAVSWASPVFFGINYACLIAVYLSIWYYHQRKKGPQSNLTDLKEDL